jgi:hypothetical protein
MPELGLSEDVFAEQPAAEAPEVAEADAEVPEPVEENEE